MIGKSTLYLAIVISSGFAIERTIVKAPAWKNAGTDEQFIAATEIVSTLDEKRGVFGQDNHGRFLSVYEKDPDHPDRTIVKFIRARENRPDKRLLEYFEYDTGTVPREMKRGGSFRLTSDEVRARLIQNGPTY